MVSIGQPSFAVNAMLNSLYKQKIFVNNVFRDILRPQQMLRAKGQTGKHFGKHFFPGQGETIKGF